MTVHDLDALTAQQLATARTASAGRSALTLSHQGHLRQTLIALAEGSALHEHEAPPAATVQVLVGRARLDAGADVIDLSAGQLTDIPQRRHGLTAIDDVVVILTVWAE